MVSLFPQCLAAPYANLDPRLKELWLDHVDEAQSLFKLIAEDPARVANGVPDWSMVTIWLAWSWVSVVMALTHDDVNSGRLAW